MVKHKNIPLLQFGIDYYKRGDIIIPKIMIAYGMGDSRIKQMVSDTKDQMIVHCQVQCCNFVKRFVYLLGFFVGWFLQYHPIARFVGE
jgi:hypothetical protein